MKIIKKYYPMLISIFFMTITALAFGSVVNEKEHIVNNSFVEISLVLLMFLLVIGIWVEIILFIIHSLKNKELKNNVLWAIIIYLFNVFIIPYYNLKYVVKEKNVIFSTIIYIILLILSIVVGYSISIRV